MRSVESIIKEMEKVDKSLEDASLKKYERLAKLDEELRQVAKENKIKLVDIYKNSLILKSKIDRARRIEKVKEYLSEKRINHPPLGVAHYEDIFRIKNKWYKQGDPNTAREEIELYLSQVEEVNQSELRKNFLPPKEKTAKEKTFIEFIEFCKAQIGLREKSPVITSPADFRKIAYVIHAATRQYAKELELLIKAITVNVHKAY